MSLHLAIQNRQRTRSINLRLLRQICAALLNDLLQVKHAELGITLTAAPEMTLLNETFLQHEGSTDVITFDHSESPRPQTPNPRTQTREPRTDLHGELFICVDEAILQAHRFRTTWQSELVRYIVHGVLHLQGHDDRRAVARRKMKLEEGRLLRLLSAEFDFQSLDLRE